MPAYGLHLLLLSDKQLYSSTGLQGGFSPLALIYYGETNGFCKKQKTNLVSPQPACFYMTRYRVFNFRLYSPMWIDFTNFMNQVQLMLFVKHFLFFPPGAADSTLKGTLPCTARLPSRLQEELTVGFA